MLRACQCTGGSTVRQWRPGSSLTWVWPRWSRWGGQDGVFQWQFSKCYWVSAIYWLLWESPVSVNTYLLFSVRNKVVDVCGTNRERQVGQREMPLVGKSRWVNWRRWWFVRFCRMANIWQIRKEMEGHSKWGNTQRQGRRKERARGTWFPFVPWNQLWALFI